MNYLGIDLGSDLEFKETKNIINLYNIKFLQICLWKISNINTNTDENVLAHFHPCKPGNDDLCVNHHFQPFDKFLTKFNSFFKKHHIKFFIHSSYAYNLASNWNTTSPWIYDIINNIYYADKIGALGIIFHLGKQLNLSHENAMNNIISSLVYIYNKTYFSKIKLILETSSGQGTEMCHDLYNLSILYKKIKNFTDPSSNRIKICVDTCHIFAAGYDITSKEKIAHFFNLFDNLIGLNNICVVHLNDSKNICKSHIDRHENIGKGFIGKKNLKIIFKFFKNRKIPCILETNSSHYIDDLRILSSSLKS